MRSIRPLMLTLPLLVSVVLAQAPTTTVGLHTRAAPGAVTPERLEQVVQVVREELKAAGIAEPLLPSEVAQRLEGTQAEGCIKGLECLFAVAQVAKLDVLVAIDVTQLEDDVAIALEAVSPVQERRLSRASVVVRAQEIATALPPQLRAFAQEVAAGLQSLDTPLAGTRPELVPGTSGQRSLFDLTTASGESRLPAYGVAGAAVVAAGVATGFAISGNRLRADFNATQTGAISSLTYPEAQRRAGAANTQLNVALAAGITSAALGGLAAWMWPTE